MNTPDGRIENVNESALRYYGRSLEELRNWACVVHLDDGANGRGEEKHIRPPGEPFDAAVRNLAADGVYR